MMGRSHALLGAIGYAALEPLSELPLPVDKVWLTAGWAVGMIAITALPNRIKDNPMDWIYRRIYWTIMVVVVLGAILLGSQWLAQFYPDLFPESPIERLIWMTVATGFALWPDIDEPNSTVSSLFGPISRVVSTATRELAGGHRKATHSWIMPILCVGLVVLGQYIPVIAGIIMSITFILAIRMVVPDKATGAAWIVMIIGFFSAWMAALGQLNLQPMILAAVAGILLHDLGDWITNTGIPFWWPVSKKYAAKLFDTGGATEVYVVRPILMMGLVAFLVIWIAIPMGDWIQTEEVGAFFEGFPTISRSS